ncbi:TonB-dependent receptor plug domain-containing protein [Colwelliaceae bacterium 6441]
MKTSRFTVFLVSVVLFGNLILSASLYAQESKETVELFSLTLEDLLTLKVTSATKQSQEVSDAPSIINVITSKEITQMGASTLTDILSVVSGFTPLKQLKSDRMMVVRGLALRDGVLVLINGVPVNDAFDGSFDFYERPVDDIQRIEVIRGPGSALYGGYAVSSVIHIFTKNEKLQPDEGRYEVRAAVGSFEERQVALNASKNLSEFIDKLNFTSSFSYFKKQGDDLLIIQDSIFRPTQAEFLAPYINPTLTPTKRQESVEKFNGHLNISYKDLTVNFTHSQLIYNPLVSHLGIVTEAGKTIKESTLDKLSAHYFWNANDKIDIDGKVYWVSNESKLFGQSQPPQIHGDEDQDGLNESFPSGIIENFQHRTETVGAELEFNYAMSDTHHILFGLVYDKTELKESQKIANVSLLSRGPSLVFPAQDLTSEFVPAGVKRDLSSFYIQDGWQISNKARLTSGVRYGDYSDFGSTLNPRLGLTYQFSNSLYSKLLYGEAFMPPAFSQLFDAAPTLSASRQQGNRDLQPTEIKTIEAQLGYEISNSLQTTVTIFSNNISNEIFFDSTLGVEKWLNSGERESQGLEFELRGAMLGLDYAFLNYSYQKTDGVDVGLGANIHSPHRINFGGNYKFSDDNLAGFTLSYFSSPAREKYDLRKKINEKFLFNLNFESVDVFIKGLSLKVVIENMLDQNGRDEVEAAIGLLDDIPIEGRSLRVGLVYSF